MVDNTDGLKAQKAWSWRGGVPAIGGEMGERGLGGREEREDAYGVVSVVLVVGE